MNTKPTFHEWLNSVETEAPNSPAGKLATAAGFTVAHTGGGCLAWELVTAPSIGFVDNEEPESCFAWITDGDADLGIEVADPEKHEWTVCVYDQDGDYNCAGDGIIIGLSNAIAWAKAALSFSDPLNYHNPKCQHRDDGRGFCIDCGKVI